MTRTLVAAGLTLRPWRADDVEALVEAHRDPVLREWLRTPVRTPAEAEHWIETQTAGRRLSFAVVPDGDPSPIAHVAITRSTDRVGEVGYWSVRRGVASRALAAVSAWALGEQGLVRLELIHTVGNDASCRVAEKCGFPLRSELPPQPPAYPGEGHLHVRTA